MAQLRQLARPIMRRGTRLHANKARPQFGKKLKNLRSTNTPADYHRAICIDAVNLKHRFRNIDSDRANLAHVFRVVKCQFGYRKVRYRGIAKNGAQVFSLLALANLYLARRKLASA